MYNLGHQLGRGGKLAKLVAKNKRYAPLFLAFAMGCILLTFQNCGQGYDSPSLSRESVDPQSPFFTQRVRLLKTGTVEKSEEQEQKEILNKEEITVLIKNKCAQQSCESAVDSQSSIVCEILKSNIVIDELKSDIQAYSWQIDDNSTEQELESELQNNSVDDDCVAGISYNLKYDVNAYASNDPQVGQEYYHDVLNGPEAYEYFYGEFSGVSIGVIDTGVTTGSSRHEDHLSVVNYRIDPGENDPNACDEVCHWHGSFVTGIISGRYNNGKGGHGILPNSTIYNFQIGDNKGSFRSTQLINALRQASYYNLDVVNMSLGGSGIFDFALQDGMITLMNRGTLLVVAAGNDSKNLGVSPFYPASFNFDGQITVGAASPEDIINASDNAPYSTAMLESDIKRDPYSNYGSGVVHIAAPGTRIHSTMLNSTYGFRSGTSFATPMVAAAAALLKGHLRFKGIDASPQLLKSMILESARSVDSLTEGTGAGAFQPVQNNRFLDLGRLAQTAREFVLRSDSKPGRIELVESRTEVVSGGQKEIVVVVDVRDATVDLDYTLRAYTNSSFLTQSFTGYQCQITGIRQVCEVRIPYNSILIDPHVYLTVTDANGILISDLTIPKNLINLGVKEEAQLKGELILANHYSKNAQVEGWACLEGFADPLEITVRIDRVDGPVVKTLTTDRQARGNYFEECQAPEITFGFRYTIPDYYYNRKLYFVARHPETGKVLNLKGFTYQPGFEDTKPPQYQDFVEIDYETRNSEINFAISKYELKNWNLSVEGTACSKSRYRPASFALKMAVDQSDSFAFLTSVPELKNKLPSSLFSTRVGDIQEAVSIGSYRRGYSISNSLTRNVANYGSLSSPGPFSDIHQVRVFDPQKSTKRFEYLTAIDDGPMGPSGVITINPTIEKNDGCPHPSGFAVNLDIRTIFGGISGSSSVTYRSDVYTESQVLQVPGLVDLVPFLKLPGNYNVDISQVEFNPALFNFSLQPSFGQDSLSLSMSFDEFWRIIVFTYEPKLRNGELTGNFEALEIKKYPASSVITNGGLIHHDLREKVIDTPSANLVSVHETNWFNIEAGKSKLFPFLSYTENTKLGYLNEDFKLQVFMEGTGLWYDIDMDSQFHSSTEARGLLTGNGRVPDLTSTRIKLRVLSNKENKLKIKALGFVVQ